MTDSVVITGGARAIGRAITLECLRLGYDVAFTHAVSEANEAATLVEIAGERHPERRCVPYALDVTDSAAVDAVADGVIDAFGDVYGVIYSAAINVDRMVPLIDDKEWDAILRTNLSGAFYTCRAFVPQLVSNRRGRIVLLSSLNRLGGAGLAAYSASKAGLIGLGRTVAKEYGALGITCNCVAPGFVEDGWLSGRGVSRELEAFWIGHAPLGRMGRTEEVAFAVGFLLSERASLVNGVTLPVTGGLDFRP